MNSKLIKRLFIVILFSALTVASTACAQQSSNQQALASNKKTSNSKQVKTKSNKPHQKKQIAKTKSTAQVRILFKRLRVAREVTSAYNRDDFEHWSDLDGNGCDTREDVLYRQNLRKGSSCRDLRGRWFSAYDRTFTTNSSSFDVDHMVPLSEAWDSGADRWSAQRREAYANDIYPYSLIAVSASSNRSKSDQDPAEWMPENRAFTCAYTARWIAVKFRWKLKVDSRERQALNKLLSSCSNSQLKLNKPVSTKPAKPIKKPVQKPGKLDPRFSSCAKAISRGYGNYKRGKDREYSWYIDGDKDGIACEK
jgi:hypothetical protein